VPCDCLRAWLRLRLALADDLRFTALDLKDARLAGIEILDASTSLRHDLLGQAEIES
jgi:hypothetical protein